MLKTSNLFKISVYTPATFSTWISPAGQEVGAGKANDIYRTHAKELKINQDEEGYDDFYNTMIDNQWVRLAMHDNTMFIESDGWDAITQQQIQNALRNHPEFKDLKAVILANHQETTCGELANG